jgi:Spy/CpxP family protein refolding chaperone
MKASKTLIIAALAVLAVGTAIQAQNSTNPPAAPPPVRARGIRAAGQDVDQLATTLKLDDATKAKVKTILDDQQKKIAALQADTALAPADRRTKMQTIRADSNKQMKAVLTGEQFAEYQKMGQPRSRRATPAAPPPQN